jgi:hypothetical protein
MIKKLIILFLLFPVSLFAQFSDDFEDGDILNWIESTTSRWSASGDSPLNGAFSLHHIFDNTVGDHDQVSVKLPTLDLSAGETSWKFRIKYDYNPSGGNNWNVFLSADADASEMFPSGAINGYVLGVNFAETDDTLRLYKITSGVREVIISTTLNWDDDTDPSDISAIEVTRSNSGDWEIEYNPMGDFGSLNSIGTGNDNTYILAEYFGIYYVYTSSADRKLWLDDIEINGEIFVDDDPPFVDSVYVQSYKNLKVGFNEKVDSVIAVNPVNYTIDGGIGNPDSISVDESYRNAELFFNQKFTDNHLYSIDIQTIEDLNGNVIKDTSINFIYEYIKPLNLEVISSNKLQIQFSRKVDTTSAKDPTNYSLDNGSGNPILAEVFAMDSTKIQLQFASDFTNKTQYILTIQNVADQNLDSLQTEMISFLYFVPEAFDVVINEIMADPYPEVNLPNYEYIEIKNTTEFDIDLLGWKLKSGTTEKDFPGATLNPDSYLILCDNDASEYLDNYGTVLEFSSFPSITNLGTVIYIFDENDNFIDSVKFTVDWYADLEKEDGGWSIERIDPLNICSGITNWKASEDANGGTPGVENSVFASNIDTETPVLEKIEIISDHQLKLIFNEPLVKTEAESNLNYLVNSSIGNPTTAVLNESLSEVDLTFSNLFNDGASYTLTVLNLDDFCGNTMNSTNMNFSYHVLKPFDIVINEIFADPDPVIGLPEYEYIEIYNTSKYEIDLSAWRLKTGSTLKDFPEYTLDSSAYLILCSLEAADYLNSYGNVLGFSSFTSITNSGTSIVILDENEQLIDSVNFTNAWYNNTDKDYGGWSLEKIDPLNICSGITNWKASEDANGGTPGTGNSVFASNIDTEAPVLEKIEIISDHQLKLIFNEPLVKTEAESNLNYLVNSSIGNPTAVVLNESLSEVDLTFSDLFNDGTSYTLTVLNLEDFCGNIMSSTNMNFSYHVLKPFDIVINEIFADPDPVIGLPEFEYIEIYNTSKYEIDLSAWRLKTGSTFKDFPNYVIDSAEYLILCSSEAETYLNTYGNVLGFSSFSTIGNSGTSISIYSDIDYVIDSINFTADWYNDPEKEDGGWSIERLDPLNTCSGITNWKVSEDLNGGTPGTENSVFASNIDIESPILSRLEVLADTQIRLVFNEPVERIVAENTLNYSVNNGIGNPSNFVLSENSMEVTLTFTTLFADGESLTLTIHNIEDYCGNVMTIVNADFVYYQTKSFDIIINEVFADSDPVIGLPEYEYIEIYNTSKYEIDLSAWRLKTGSTLKDFPEYTLDSSAYLILCSLEAADYLNSYGNVLGFSSFSSITNSGTSIAILDENEQLIDSVNFTTEWYNDTDKENGGWSIERIDPLNTCSTKSNWKASENVEGGTPGMENSVFASNIDNDSPAVDYMEILSDNQLRLFFTEPVSEESILEQLNYFVNNGIGNPMSVLPSTDFMEVELLFSESFPAETELVLTIADIGDECGNLMSLTDIDFLYYVVNANDVVINEIMADPDPAIELPEYEYIEIYNTSDFEIDLTGWKLVVGTSEKEFSSATIESGEYIVLCDDEAESELQTYSKIITFSSFPTIPNSEQIITLRNKSDQIINTIHYTDEWYKDDYKAEGGWSLEQIDPMNPCGGINNWIASESNLGGTPGQINSANASNPDDESPELLHISLSENNKIRLFFNESIDSIFAMQLTNYNVDFGVGNPTQVTLVGPDYMSIFLDFTNDFSSNTIYTCEITGGILDCSGNEIAEKNTAKFAIPVDVNENNIVINEILFNPYTDGFDFVELYNRSEYTIDLKDVFISTYDYDAGEYKDVEQISTDGYLIFPNEYVVITEKPEIIKEQYYTSNPKGFVEIKNLPSFSDDAGRVILFDKIQTIIEDFEYNEDMQYPLLATKEGVALERINFERPTNDKTNWHSASELAGFATPAYKNSQFLETEDIKEIVQVEPEVFSPDNDGFEDFANINFLLNEPGYVANIKIYDSKGRLVRYLANNQLLGVNETITWDGLDEKNQKAYVGIYVVFIELYDLDGNVKQYKETVVVAAKY